MLSTAGDWLRDLAGFLRRGSLAARMAPARAAAARAAAASVASNDAARSSLGSDPGWAQ